MVLNDASALNSERASVTVIGRDGSERRIDARSKDEIAAVLVELDAPTPSQ